MLPSIVKESCIKCEIFPPLHHPALQPRGHGGCTGATQLSRLVPASCGSRIRRLDPNRTKTMQWRTGGARQQITSNVTEEDYLNLAARSLEELKLWLGKSKLY